MAQRPNIPKFGDWKNEGNVPYTVYFEKAKASRGGKIINPNDPQQNPGMFPNIPAPAPAPPSRPQPKEPTGRRVDKTRISREESEFRQFSDSPARKTGTANGSTQPGRGSGRPSMPRGGSEHSVDRSPAHQARPSGGRGNIGSPVWEGKRPNERSTQGTPGRSRMNPSTRSNEALARDVAIPKFGEWDVKNPEAENFTYIFNKNSRNANASGTNSTPSNNTNANQNSDDDAKFARRSCFQWWKK